jgi:hypothetical protein
MAISTTRVIENNGFVYPYVLINLAISPKYDETTPAADIEGNVSMMLTPYRVLPNGLMDIYVEGRYSMYLSDIYKEAETDPDLAQAMGYIITGIQFFINAKGL